VVAFFQSIIGFIESIGLSLQRVTGAFNRARQSLLESVLGGPARILDSAFEAAAGDLAGTGVFAFVVAVVIAAMVAYIVSWGVTQVVE
jgi:hypothetical protein